MARLRGARRTQSGRHESVCTPRSLVITLRPWTSCWSKMKKASLDWSYAMREGFAKVQLCNVPSQNPAMPEPARVYATYPFRRVTAESAGERIEKIDSNGRSAE